MHRVNYDQLETRRRDERGIREREQGVVNVLRFEPGPPSRPAGQRRRDALHLQDYDGYELTLDAVEALDGYAGADREVHRYRLLMESEPAHQLTPKEAANVLRRIAENPTRWAADDTLMWVRSYEGDKAMLTGLRTALAASQTLTVEQFTTAVRIREELAGVRPVRRSRAR